MAQCSGSSCNHPIKTMFQGQYQGIQYELSKCSDRLCFSAQVVTGPSQGQCLELKQELYPNDPKVREIVEVWKRWHLNNMRAGCEHQRVMAEFQATLIGGKREVRLNPLVRKSLEQDLEARQAECLPRLFWDIHSKLGTEHFIKCSVAGRMLYLTHVFELMDWTPAHIAEQRLKQITTGSLANDCNYLMFWTQNFEEHTTEAVWNCNTYFHEHPEGILCKPCPVCSYEYGTAWLHETLPEHVVAQVLSWGGKTPGYTE